MLSDWMPGIMFEPSIRVADMTQHRSVCLQLSAFMRLGTTGLLKSWRLVAVAAVVCWSGNVIADSGDSGDGFSPQLILVVDESGSMRGRHSWLADALPALGQALNDRNVNSLLIKRTSR